MNYYELLGVKKNATEEEIKQAYKKQMKKWHPDINKSEDAISMSAKINEAKEVLLDAEKRKDYDEYLKKKIDENYNRYTQKKASENNSNQNSQYEDQTVTKWQYLKDWLKYAKVSTIRKIFGFIGVMLESFLCWLIKMLLIIIAVICNFGSYMIRSLFSYLAPVIGILLILFLGQCIINGFTETINSNDGSVKAIIIFVVLFISSLLLPIFSKLILSPKVFDILYNKIDVNLFKKCVGYKD
jgi:cation transport ATPase